MSRKEKIRRWIVNSTVGTIAAANALVFLAAFLQTTQTYEPGFLAATTGILVVMHSITKRRFDGAVAGLSAVCSGFLWMRGSVESESPNLETSLGILLILAFGLTVYGILAFCVWFLARND